MTLDPKKRNTRQKTLDLRAKISGLKPNTYDLKATSQNRTYKLGPKTRDTNPQTLDPKRKTYETRKSRPETHHLKDDARLFHDVYGSFAFMN